MIIEMRDVPTRTRPPFRFFTASDTDEVHSYHKTQEIIFPQPSIQQSIDIRLQTSLQNHFLGPQTQNFMLHK